MFFTASSSLSPFQDQTFIFVHKLYQLLIANLRLARLNKTINSKSIFLLLLYIKHADLLLMQIFIKEWRVHEKPQKKKGCDDKIKLKKRNKENLIHINTLHDMQANQSKEQDVVKFNYRRLAKAVRESSYIINSIPW